MALRRQARMRCRVDAPVVRTPTTDARTSGSPLAFAVRISWLRRSIAANMALMWPVRSLSSGTSPRCGIR